MRHGDQIILPYAVSDTFPNFATIKIGGAVETVRELMGAHSADLLPQMAMIKRGDMLSMAAKAIWDLRAND